ncbi:MAG: hypothetical protein AAF846_06620 [Chloroflexota bacterium]
MTIIVPTLKNKARFLMIGYGLILLFWMSLENRDTLIVALLGTGATLIYLGSALLKRFGGREFTHRAWSTAVVFLGAVFGGLSVVTTALLMFFKSSWHGHLYPDFPPAMIWAMLMRLPYWMLSGALLGLCCSILLFVRQATTKETNFQP